MELLHQRFLEALKCSLEKKKVEWKEEITKEEWVELFTLAQEHHILPLIYDAIYSCKSAKDKEELLLPYKKRVKQMTINQIVKTDQFLQLYSKLIELGLKPKIVKGIICRQLYPNPDYRSSSDEDMLVDEKNFMKYHNFFLENEMFVTDANIDIENVYEVGYRSKISPVYIELHKTLFPKESKAYGEFNKYFKDVHSSYSSVNVNGVEVYTLNSEDHLFYLITHAFKHFLHSGFGIRQVCDIILFANAYGNEINWDQLYTKCEEIHALKFSAALFKIGETYLTFSSEKANMSQKWKDIKVEEEALLMDLLDSGVFGSSDMSRKHSSNMTLNALINKKENKKGNHLIQTIFPPLQSLKGTYTYLNKNPLLLPVAWISRIISYMKESRKDTNNNAKDSIALGNKRIALLKQYEIID